MIFELEKGNLITLLENDEIDYLIHQTNCFQSIGEKSASGIAQAIQDKYPEVVEADLSYVKGDINQLGKYLIIPVKTSNGKTKHIINLYSQYSYGFKHGTPTHYDSMAKGLFLIYNALLKLKSEKPIRIGTYQLGCNRGGADWNIVQKYLRCFKNSQYFDLRVIV